MKKSKLIPIGIAACLAVGIYGYVSGDMGEQATASVSNAIGMEDSFIDSLIDDIFGNNSEGKTDVLAEAEKKTVASVSVKPASDADTEASDEVAGNSSTYDEEQMAEATDAVEDKAVYEEVADDVVVYEEGVGEAYVSENSEKELLVESSTFTSIKTQEENCLSEERVEKPDSDTVTKKIDEDAKKDIVETEGKEECDHEWLPVTILVHHDEKSHKEEVVVHYEDNNKSFYYCDADGNEVCSCIVYGTIDRYEDDVLVSSEGVEKAGMVEISNALTKESFVFAPGELEDRDSFIKDMFDDDIYAGGAMIGPAYTMIEERTVIDEAAFDEEVVVDHVCNICGEHRD